MVLCFGIYHRHCFAVADIHDRHLLNSNPHSARFPTVSFSTPISATSQISASPIDSLPSVADAQPFSIDSGHFSRRQNSAHLLHSQFEPQFRGSGEFQEGKEELAEDGDEMVKKKVVEEMSLVTRRERRFPGSIDFPGGGQRLGQADLWRVLDGDDETLKRAVAVRRGVAAETLKVALRAGKLSVNYADNLVSQLPDFIDRIVIGAAALKADPELSHLTFNARARSYIQTSGVVPLVKWLKHNSMSYPCIGRIICMCSGDLEQVRMACEWLKTIHVKGEFFGSVLVKGGPIWERDQGVLEEIVGYLEHHGVRRDWMGIVIGRCPQVLSFTMEELEARVKFFLNMGMSKVDLGTMVYDYPRVIGFFSIEEMNSKVNYLKEFGLRTEEIGEILAFKPQLMTCSIDEKWKPLVKYLYYLGIRRDGMKRMLMVKPMIFCIDLQKIISPKVRFLQDIGVKDEAIGNVLVKFPQLLTYSLYKKIRPVVIFLMTKAGVTQEDIGKVIALDPQLVGCSITKKLDINVKYYLSLGIRLESLGRMISDFPMLLRYNLDVVAPKYRYLRRTMVRPLQDLIEFPRFFSYSLEGRITPRHEILVASRVKLNLRYMLSGSDDDFNARVEAAVERRRSFEAGEVGGTEHGTSAPPTTLADSLGT